MLSIPFRRNKFNIIPFYKGQRMSSIYADQEHHQINDNTKIEWLKCLYKFGVKNIKGYENYKILESASIDEALVLFASIIELKLKVNVKFCPNNLFVGKLIHETYDVVAMPIKPIHDMRKDKEFYKILLTALSVLRRKGLSFYNDYSTECVLENIDQEVEWQKEGHQQYDYARSVHKRYEYFVKPMIADMPKKWNLSKLNLKKYYKKYPYWSEFLKDVFSLDKLDANIWQLFSLNIGEEESDEGYIDVYERYHCTWAGYREDCEIDDYVYQYFNERMNNYTVALPYMCIDLMKKETYNSLKIKVNKMNKLMKVLNKSYACIYN